MDIFRWTYSDGHTCFVFKIRTFPSWACLIASGLLSQISSLEICSCSSRPKLFLRGSSWGIHASPASLYEDSGYFCKYPNCAIIIAFIYMCIFLFFWRIVPCTSSQLYFSPLPGLFLCLVEPAPMSSITETQAGNRQWWYYVLW